MRQYNVLDERNLLQDEEFIKLCSEQESANLVRPGWVIDETLERLAGGGIYYGDQLPWSKTRENFRMRPGEVTLWCGVNGHGKSLLTSHVAVHLAQSRVIAIASIEMPLPATNERMIKQLAGTTTPTEAWARRALAWMDRNIWLYTVQSTVSPASILGFCRYAAQECECDHVFIDSLVKVRIGQEDFDGQTAFMDALVRVARNTGLHIHVVHHTRKGRSEHDVPDKFDVKGAGALVDLVDNCCIVHRRKQRTDDEAQPDTEDDRNPPTAKISVVKQRFGEWEGEINLWHHPCGQFLQHPEAKPAYIDIG